VDGITYGLTSKQQSWHKARAQCRTAGMDLVSISSSTTGAMLYTKVKELLPSATAYYAGLTDRAQEGQWAWIGGADLTFTDWLTGEPDGGRSHNCGQVLSTGKWSDVDCSTPLPAVCGPAGKLGVGGGQAVRHVLLARHQLCFNGCSSAWM
jgi:hypothetical protein